MRSSESRPSPCSSEITLCRNTSSAACSSTYGTGTHSPDRAHPPRDTRAWTCGCQPARSPAVCTAATMPGCGSGSSAAAAISSRTVSHAARASLPSSSRWWRKWGPTPGPTARPGGTPGVAKRPAWALAAASWGWSAPTARGRPPRPPARAAARPWQRPAWPRMTGIAPTSCTRRRADTRRDSQGTGRGRARYSSPTAPVTLGPELMTFGSLHPPNILPASVIRSSEPRVLEQRAVQVAPHLLVEVPAPEAVPRLEALLPLPLDLVVAAVDQAVQGGGAWIPGPVDPGRSALCGHGSPIARSVEGSAQDGARPGAGQGGARLPPGGSLPPERVRALAERAASTASWRASDMVGWGWMVSPTSSRYAPISRARVASPISSDTPRPTAVTLDESREMGG